MSFLWSKKGITIIALISVFVFLYLFTGVFGETRINLTLRTNPDLNRGLVAHYTFDSSDVSGFTVSDSAGSNDGGIVATTTPSSDVQVDDTAFATDDDALWGTSPNTVWVSDQIGYVFYLDSTGSAVVASTTDGGTSWSSTQDTVDSQTDVVHIAVWYDKWTPNDIGTKIHVATFDDGSDELYYTEYDTADDTVSATIQASTGNSGALGEDSYHSITKTENGDLYIQIMDPADEWIVRCLGALDCTNSSNWSEIIFGGAGGSNDPSILMPVPGTNNVMSIALDYSATDLEYDIYSATTSSWWGDEVIDGNADYYNSNAWGAEISAALNKQTGEIYVSFVDDNNDYSTQDHDIVVYKMNPSTFAWSALTEPVTNASGGLVANGIVVDDVTGDLYVVYIRRTTIGNGATSNIYYKISTDGGSTWSQESPALNSYTDEMVGLGVNLTSNGRVSVAYKYTGVSEQDDFFVRVVSDISDRANEKTTPGNIGQAMEFDGDDDYVDMGLPAALNNLDDITVSAWIYPRSNGESGEGTIAGIGGSSRTAGWGLRLNNNRLNFLAIDGANNTEWVSANSSIQFNKWQHVVVVFANDGSSPQFFIDGEASNATIYDSGNNVKNNNSDRDFLIGNMVQNTVLNDWTFDGYIDDVRYYSGTLSASTIQRLYQLGATTRIAETITTNPDLENGLVGHWTFDGTSIDISSTTAEALDRSGNDNHGDWLNHNETVAAGNIGQAIDFDGTDDYISIPYTTDLTPTNITYAAWVKFDFIGNSDEPHPLENQGTGIQGYGFYVDDGIYDIRSFLAIDSSWNVRVGPVVYADRWYHLSASYDGTDHILYVNGEEVDRNTDAGSISHAATTTKIGVRHDFLPDRFMDGVIDDVRIYNRALSPAEILRLYQLGATTKVNTTITTNPDLKRGLVTHWSMDKDIFGEVADFSTSNNVGFHTATSSVRVKPGVIGQARLFNNDNDVLHGSEPSSVNFGTNNMSAFAWIYVINIDDAAGDRVLHDRSRGSNAGWQIKVREDSNNWGLYDTVIDDGTDSWFGCQTWCGDDRYSLNEWHHVGITWNNNGSSDVLTIYVNGVLSTSTSATGNIGSITNSIPIEVGGSVYLNGSASCCTQEFDGYIDDVRVYNRALSDAEVLRLYQLGN